MTLPYLPLALADSPDVISLIMAGLALFMTLCAALYTTGYGLPGPRLTRRLFWYGLWGFGLFSVLTVLASDWFSLTIFIEMASVSLFLMVLPGDRDTAFMYLLTQLAGAGFLLIGTGLLYLQTGQVGLDSLSPGALPWLLAGLGIKAALPGLHFWLPRTHSRAPTPASALLSGFAVKMGIYGLMRLSGPETQNLFLTVGVAMALYGVTQALLQYNAKRLLAFHTISQLGFVLSALGSGTQEGLTAALFYSLSHGLFKGLLFCSAGMLEKTFRTHDLNRLASMGQASGPVLILFLVGALAIAGFPGTSGFIAKTLVKTALKGGHHTLAIQALLLAGLGTTVSFSKLAWYGFLGGKALTVPKHQPDRVHDNPRCLTAMALLATATLLLGVLPVSHPHLLRGNAVPWFGLSNLLPGLLPILGGVTLFSLFPAVFRPHRKDVPDLYGLLARTRLPYGKLIQRMADLHNGRLRLYLFIMLSLGILILSTLQFL